MPTLKNGHIPQLLATEYASYRDQVIEVLSARLMETERSRSHPLVLYDPMAGTAPLLGLAERRGYTAHFNDLNSLHRYVNVAKTLPCYLTFRDIGPAKLLSIVCEMTKGINRCRRTATEQWIEGSVLEKLRLAWVRSEEQSETMGALAKAILVLAIRDFSSFKKTKNGTWLIPGGLRPKISAEEAFHGAIERLGTFYECTYAKESEMKGGRIFLTDYDASEVGPRGKVDTVVTSPPFCNRVDWDRLYGPEHFFLTAVGGWHARTEFLGTTAVRHLMDFESDFKFVIGRSDYLLALLKEVRKRQLPKERRSDYYVKYFTRYFASLFRVFDTAARILRNNNAGIYFVVQDNTHRGLSIKIHKALAESLSKQGFHSERVKRWERRHQGLRNVSKRYRAVTPKQWEYVWRAIR